MENDNSGNYYAYLLRFWRDDKNSPWRIMLENPHTEQTFGFSSMASLYAFLDEQTNQKKE